MRKRHLPFDQTPIGQTPLTANNVRPQSPLSRDVYPQTLSADNYRPQALTADKARHLHPYSRQLQTSNHNSRQGKVYIPKNLYTDLKNPIEENLILFLSIFLAIK